MPHPSRPVTLSLRPAALIACIAVGVWLGGLALLLCLWLFSHVLPLTAASAPQTPTASVQAPAAVAPAPAHAPPAAADGSEEGRRFERYLERLQQQDANDAVRREPSALSNPRCQFWLEQQRTAPTPASQAQVETYCP